MGNGNEIYFTIQGEKERLMPFGNDSKSKLSLLFNVTYIILNMIKQYSCFRIVEKEMQALKWQMYSPFSNNCYLYLSVFFIYLQSLWLYVCMH